MIRTATYDDIEQICDLSNEINIMHSKSMPEEFKLPDSRLRDAPYWKTYLDNQGSIVYVAEINGVIVGAICAKVILNTMIPFIVQKKKCHIGTVVVSKKQTRSGIGRVLMATVEAFAQESGCKAIHLEVMEFNIGATDFYKTLGYGYFSRKMAKSI